MKEKYIRSTDQTEREGVYDIGKAITKRIGWIFREQPILDIGIDAIIEQKIEGKATGQFIALQIKSGKSYLANKNDSSVGFLIDLEHFKYWRDLCIPFIIIIYDTLLEISIWEVFNSDKLKKNKNSYRLDIPRNNILDEKSVIKLNNIIESNINDFLNDDEEQSDYNIDSLQEMSILYLEESRNTFSELRNIFQYHSNKCEICKENMTNLIVKNMDEKDSNATIHKGLVKYSNQLSVIRNITATKIKSTASLDYRLFMKFLRYELLILKEIKHDTSLLDTHYKMIFDLINIKKLLMEHLFVISKVHYDDISDLKLLTNASKNNNTVLIHFSDLLSSMCDYGNFILNTQFKNIKK
jgi:hypothetical protein